MTHTDLLLRNNEAYAACFDKSDPPAPPARTDKVRGFVYEVETGRLREVG